MSRKLKIVGGYHAGQEVEIEDGHRYVVLEELRDIHGGELCSQCTGGVFTVGVNTHTYRVEKLHADGMSVEFLAPEWLTPRNLLIELLRGYKS